MYCFYYKIHNADEVSCKLLSCNKFYLCIVIHHRMECPCIVMWLELNSVPLNKKRNVEEFSKVQVYSSSSSFLHSAAKLHTSCQQPKSNCHWPPSLLPPLFICTGAGQISLTSLFCFNEMCHVYTHTVLYTPCFFAWLLVYRSLFKSATRSLFYYKCSAWSIEEICSCFFSINIFFYFFISWWMEGRAVQCVGRGCSLFQEVEYRTLYDSTI